MNRWIQENFLGLAGIVVGIISIVVTVLVTLYPAEMRSAIAQGFFGIQCLFRQDTTAFFLIVFGVEIFTLALSQPMIRRLRGIKGIGLYFLSVIAAFSGIAHVLIISARRCF